MMLQQSVKGVSLRAMLAWSVMSLFLGLATMGVTRVWADEAKPANVEELQKVEAKAEEAKVPEKPQWSLSMDFFTQYLWRGIALSRSSAVLQPSFTGTYKGISVNVWNNIDTSEHNPFGLKHPNSGQMRWNETDLTVSYSREVITNFTLTGGFIYYILDSNNSAYNSLEVYTGADYKLPWFNFGVSVYREVNHFPGTYLQWYIHRAIDIPLMEGMNLDLFASWSAEFSNDKAAYPVFDSQGNVENKFYQSLSAGNLAATLNIPLGKHVIFAPKVQYWYALGGQSTATLAGLSWDGKHNHVFGGANLTVNF
jgi:hypothetical protein